MEATEPVLEREKRRAETHRLPNMRRAFAEALNATKFVAQQSHKVQPQYKAGKRRPPLIKRNSAECRRGEYAVIVKREESGNAYRKGGVAAIAVHYGVQQGAFTDRPLKGRGRGPGMRTSSAQKSDVNDGSVEMR